MVRNAGKERKSRFLFFRKFYQSAVERGKEKRKLKLVLELSFLQGLKKTKQLFCLQVNKPNKQNEINLIQNTVFLCFNIVVDTD